MQILMSVCIPVYNMTFSSSFVFSFFVSTQVPYISNISLFMYLCTLFWFVTFICMYVPMSAYMRVCISFNKYLLQTVSYSAF